MNTFERMNITHYNLTTHGNKRILKHLRNKGYQYSDDLYEISHNIADYHEDMVYLEALDQAWSKEYTRLARSYRQACKIAMKIMRRRSK